MSLILTPNPNRNLNPKPKPNPKTKRNPDPYRLGAREGCIGPVIEVRT